MELITKKLEGLEMQKGKVSTWGSGRGCCTRVGAGALMLAPGTLEHSCWCRRSCPCCHHGAVRNRMAPTCFPSVNQVPCLPVKASCSYVLLVETVNVGLRAKDRYLTWELKVYKLTRKVNSCLHMGNKRRRQERYIYYDLNKMNNTSISGMRKYAKVSCLFWVMS